MKREKEKRKRKKRGALWAALILFVGCARQMAPPGGPADMTPPYVVLTIPANDSVGVGNETTIQIQFSEAMDHRLVEEALFISPQSAQSPKFRWRKDLLEIRLLDGLREDRTYVVTVGQASADEWRNRMLASRSFRFATGDVVNRGELFGRVVRSKEHMGQAFAWLYDLGVASEPDLMNDLAHYVTQPDDAGHFQFSGLGPGVYRVFVFIDADQNLVYTPGKDALAVPPGDVMMDADQKSFRLSDLKSVVRDTSAPTLSAVRTSDQNHVLMRFDEPVRVVGSPVVADLEVKSVYQDVDSSRVGLFTDIQENGRAYSVRISVTDRWGNGADIETSVRGDATADRRAPDVLDLKPSILAVNVLPNASLEMVFSDAMSQDVVAPFWDVSDTTLSPEGHFGWVTSNRLVFLPKGSWPLDRVRLQSHQGTVKDGVGNVLDGRITFDFTVIDAQDVGTIAGLLEPLNNPAVVEAVSMDVANLSYTTQIASGDSTFEMTGVLPGLYRISGFVDADGNGFWARGESKPFVPSETLFSLSDTVEARARWTVNTCRLEARRFLLPVTEDAP